jgi:hypothetical protein
VTRSKTGKDLLAEKSKFAAPADRRFESTRRSFPKEKGPGWVKHDVLNHLAALLCCVPDTFLMQPGTTFGRIAFAPKYWLR